MGNNLSTLTYPLEFIIAVYDGEVIIKQSLNAFEMDDWNNLPEGLRFTIAGVVGNTIAEYTEELNEEYSRNESILEQYHFGQDLVNNIRYHLEKVLEDPHLKRNKKLHKFVEDLERCFDDSMFEY